MGRASQSTQIPSSASLLGFSIWQESRVQTQSVMETNLSAGTGNSHRRTGPCSEPERRGQRSKSGCVCWSVCEGLKSVKRLVSRSSSSAPLMIFLHIPFPSSLLCSSLAVFLLLFRFFNLSFYTFFLCFSVFVLFFQSDYKEHQMVSVLNISPWFIFSLKVFLLR